VARVCQRPGCGREVLNYRMRFHSAECKNADYAERQRDRRAAARKGRCPTCGHRHGAEPLPIVLDGSQIQAPATPSG
jgi:hypothetical protein